MSRTTSTPTNSPIGGQFTSVASAVGFSTGDLVYRTNTGYSRVPDGSVLTATFPNSVTAPVYASGPLETTQVATDSINAGGQNDQCAARLTNGNIVVVYTKPGSATPQQGFYYFRIVNTANTVVVAETLIEAGVYSLNSKSCSVVALSVGGFAVAFRASQSGSNLFYFKSYNNSGVNTSSAITGSVYSTAQLVTKMVPRTDGGYIFAGVNSSSQPFYSIRNSVSSSLTTALLGLSVGSDSSIAIERFSDDSFIYFQRTAGSTISWYYRDASGSALNSGTITTNGTINSISACRLNSNILAVYVATSTGLEYFRVAQAGNGTPSAVVQLFTGSASSNACAAYTKSGTNTNIVLFSYETASGTGASAYGGMSYYVVDGSTGAIQGSTTPRVVSGVASYAQRTGVAFVEFDTTIRAYVRGGMGNSTDAQQAITAGSTHFINFNNTTFVPESFDSAGTKIIGNTSEQAVSLYSRAGSTPTAGSFIAAASVDTSATITQGTVILPQTTIEAIACNSYQLLSLSTGNTLALYKTNAANLIKFAVINNSGVVVGLYPVATGYSIDSGARACELSNGNIVIAYHATNLKINYAIYSPSFVLQSSGELPSLTTISMSAGNSPGALSIAALTQSSRFVVGYLNSSNISAYNVYSSTGTYIYGSNTSITSSGGICCIGLKNGGFAFWYSTTSADNRMRLIVSKSPVNDNDYEGLDLSITGSGTSVPYGFTAYHPAHGYFPYFQFTSGNIAMALHDMTGAQVTSAAALGAIGAAGSGFASCTTAEGITMVHNRSPRNFYTYYANLSTAATVETFSSATALPSVWASVGESCATIAPFYGPYFIAGVLNASRFPTYAVVSSRTISYPVSITANVTSSNLTPLPTSSFALVGVAASDCPAGGVGQVQTGGTAVLSSSYPSTTSETFDFTNPVTYGVKGAINGRVITMES